MELERAGQHTVSTFDQGNLLKESTARWYGLNNAQFRAMVLDFILRDFVIGPAPLRKFHRDVSYTGTVESERIELVRHLLDGASVTVQLSHAGRIHLWNQRDALLRDPDLEPFGLRSRAAWDRDLFLRLRWATEQEPLSIMFLDLDNFGRVNKEYGAPVGDAVLRLVFGLVKSAVGTRGAAYRYGGEEVGVLLPGIGLEAAARLAEELRTLIERDVRPQIPQLEAPQTASIGVTEFTGPLENDAAVARVDDLMRQAKRSGKNQVVCDDAAAERTP